MNIIQHLRKEHEEFRKGLKKLEKNPAGFEQLQKDIMAHSKAEEKVFYPPLREKKETHDLILEGIEEHRSAELFMKDMAKAREKADGDLWKAKVSVLTELVEHHLEEEETGVFPPAEKLLSAEELKQLNEKFEKEEQRLKSK